MDHSQKYFHIFLTGIFFLKIFCTTILRPKKIGVVYFHDTVPAQCKVTRGIKQKKVIPVYSENELRKHYDLTFQIRFNDEKSPRLYGSLYYQDREKNLYCLALPNGRFATFSDSKIDIYRHNIIQELCYPIQECKGY